MPVRAVCPECGATTSLSDESTDPTVECSQCGTRVSVPGAKANGQPRSAAADDGAGFDVVDEDDDDSTEFDETGRPIVGRRRSRDDDDYDDRPRRRGRDDDDDVEEDEDDDRPRRSARARDDDDEEDEDEDDRPRRSARARDDDDEEDDDDDARPRKSARARGRDDDDEDDDEDDRPRRGSRARTGDEDEDDDDDEEEDSKVRSRTRAKSRDEDEDEDEDEEDDDRPRGRRSDDEDEDEDEGKEISDEEAKAIAPQLTANMREMLANGEKGRDEEEDEDDEEDEPRRARGRAADEDDEEDGEDEDEDDKSRSRSRSDGGPPKRHWPSDEDDEDRDEDEEEDEDRPRRAAAAKKSGAPVLLIVGLLAFLVVGIGGGATAYFLLWDDKPEVALIDDSTPPPGPDPGPVQPGPVQPGPDQPGPKKGRVRRAPAGPLAIRPADFDAVKDKPAIPLPGKVTDACAGAGGRFLFFHCAAEKKLVVFDVSALTPVKEIPTTGPNTLVAAGATRLLLADREAKTVRRWDLVKMEQDKEGPLPFDGQLTALSLGAASDGPALLVGKPGPSGAKVGFLDPESLGPAAVGWAGLPADIPPDVRVRAAGNGSQWVAVTAGGQPKRFVVTRAGNKVVWQPATEAVPAYAALSDDGYTLYSPAGPSEVGARPGKQAGSDVWVPAVHGPFCLHFKPGGDATTAVLARDGKEPLGTVNALSLTEPNNPLTPDQLAFLVPDAHAVVHVAPERDRLTVTPFDIPAALSKAGRPALYLVSTPPTTFTPGRAFEYAVRVYASAPDVKYSVTGVQGATVSPEGKVRWDVPANLSDDRGNVMVTASIPGATGSQSLGLYNAAAPAPKSPEPKKVVDAKTKEPPKTPVAVASKLVNPVPGRLPITPAEMADPHVEVAVPGPIRDACVAGGGRYLIFHCPTARKLAVFDVSALKVTKTITLNADDVLFAAGMEKLAVVYPDEKLIIRYSLASFRPETDATLEARQRPTAAAMGNATAGPLILGGIPAQGNASKMLLMFLDLDTLAEVPIAKAEGDFQVTFGSAAHLRASGDGRTLGAWFAQLLPSGLQLARLDGNTITGTYKRETVGHVVPGADGQMVFTQMGLFSAKGEPLARKEPAIPAVHGGGFLTVTEVPMAEQAKLPATAKRVAVWEAGKGAPVATFDGLPGFDGKRDPFERDNPLPLDKRLFLVPEAGILVVVPPTADRLHVYKLAATQGEPKKGGG